MIYDRVPYAFSMLCENLYGANFGGFADPGDISPCHPKTPSLQTIQGDVEAGRSILQILGGGHHYVLTTKKSNEDFITVYDSLNEELSDHVKLQISLLYGNEVRPVLCKFSQVHRQPMSSNLCAVFATSFMAEAVIGRSPEQVIFVKDQQQRQWLHDCIEENVFKPCPHRRGKKSNKDLTEQKIDVLITPEDAAVIRRTMSNMPNRRISLIKNRSK